MNYESETVIEIFLHDLFSFIPWPT
jgi:hypothetical protein